MACALFGKGCVPELEDCRFCKKKLPKRYKKCRKLTEKLCEVGRIPQDVMEKFKAGRIKKRNFNNRSNYNAT